MKEEQLQHHLNELRKENQRLRESVRELSVLNEVALAIRSAFSLDQVIDLIVQKCVKHFQVEQAAVWLLTDQAEQGYLQTMVRGTDRSTFQTPFRLDTQLTGWMLKYRRPLRINDFASDLRFGKTRDAAFPVSSLLAIPLILRQKLLGMICLFNKKDAAGFTDADQRLLSILATQSAQVIENHRLYEEEQELARLQEELRTAARIQENLLPKTLPKIPGYDLAAFNLPARSVSGDYYDFIPLPNSRLAFCLGDVSGKGMPAALLMANLQATLRGQVLLDLMPEKCLSNTNFLLYKSTTPEKFATLFLGLLNFETNRLTYCNAGHDAPFLVSRTAVNRLTTGGTVLGFMEAFPFEQTTLDFNSGNVLVLYSDGITETMNDRGEEFGETRLQECICKVKDQPAATILKHILSNVNQFKNQEEQIDDMTLVVVKRN